MSKGSLKWCESPNSRSLWFEANYVPKVFEVNGEVFAPCKKLEDVWRGNKGNRMDRRDVEPGYGVAEWREVELQWKVVRVWERRRVFYVKKQLPDTFLYDGVWVIRQDYSNRYGVNGVYWKGTGCYFRVGQLRGDGDIIKIQTTCAPG